MATDRDDLVDPERSLLIRRPDLADSLSRTTRELERLASDGQVPAQDRWVLRRALGRIAEVRSLLSSVGGAWAEPDASTCWEEIRGIQGPTGMPRIDTPIH